MAAACFAFTQPRPRASLCLFCFSYAGGSAAVFRSWPDHLPTTIDVRPVELPGHGTRLKEAPVSQLETLITALAGALHPYLDIPFAFFGHSMGALIGFELARYLRREYGQLPEHLFVSAFHAPQLMQSESRCSVLSDEDIIEKLRKLGGTPPEVLAQPELMRLVLPAIRADFQLCDAYEYKLEPPLPCPITAFGGLQDRVTSRSELEAWRLQSLSSFDLHMFPGNHFFLQTARPLLFTLFEQTVRQVEGRMETLA